MIVELGRFRASRNVFVLIGKVEGERRPGVGPSFFLRILHCLGIKLLEKRR